jgi:hypothetical protein
VPNPYPAFVFGMHDRGGEHLMLDKDKRGWVLVTEALGADPNNGSGSNYTDLASQGLGVIARLNHGYGSTGTIPLSSQYGAFARRCGNFVQASPGCRIWIIGNEMNLAAERPGGPGGQVITPELYATCFRLCRDEIRSRPDHAADQVVPGAVGPWNIQTKYPGNLNGDWVRYFADILALLGQELDGIALHTYSHGQHPDLVFSDAKMDPPFQAYHWHFRAYRDFMAAIPEALRNRPVYITEADQYGAWLDQNSGWVRNAYQEIDAWSRQPGQQPIQALILYRWIVGNANDPQEVGWAISNKAGVQADFGDAMANDYAVVRPSTQPEYLVAWLEVAAPTRMNPGAPTTFAVSVRNDGRRSWANSGTAAVRLGHRWIDAQGAAVEGQRTSLPGPVPPGATVTFNTQVQAPATPGFYTLHLDMVQGAAGWFADKGSPPWRAEIQVGPRYAVAWLHVQPPASGLVDEATLVPTRMRNAGALTWVTDGPNPFFLTYRWLAPDRQVVVADGLRTPLGRPVAPGQEISLQAQVLLPSEPGAYILQMDMVHEFVTWFQWRGSPVYEAQVEVQPAVPDYAAEWLTYVGPDRLVVGQSGAVLVEVKNAGALPWPPVGAQAVRLGCRWLDAQGNEVPVADAQTWPVPRQIEPGQVATFRDLVLTAPAQPGSYRLVWDLLQAGTWLSSRGVAVMERAVQVMAREYGVVWQVLTPWPAWLPPDAVQQVDLLLHNTGSRPWAAGGRTPVHLAYTWFTPAGQVSEPMDTFRILLPGDVAPGASVILPAVPYRTPAALGHYLLRWDLVEEGVTWFFRQGAPPLEVAIEVSDRSLFVPWTAQASHNQEGTPLAFDGDPQTAWSSVADQVPGMWFQVDLGQVLVLDRFRAASAGRGFPAGYRLKLSTDGQDWHLVAEKAQNWSNVDVAFAPCPARYVRLEQTAQPSWAATWMMGEITVSATQAWAGADASHYAGDARQAIDARLRTAWNTRAVKQRPGMWFEIDMGSVRRIEGLTLEHPTSQMPRGYAVSVAGADRVWQEVARKDDNWGQVDVRFAETAARYVRVETTNSSTYHPWGIVEFVVWRAAPLWLVGREQT